MSLRARKRFGQHFLAPAWADKVVEAIAPAAADRFLEIGPGHGVLTTRLAARASRVTAIEIDRDLAAELRALLLPAVDVVNADILDVDLTAYLDNGAVRVAGNLPYNISSPILFRLLAAGRPPADATLMLQREVAERLAGRPGTKEYGVLAILAAARADVHRLLTLPAGAFRPAPKVQSAVVRLSFVPPRVPAPIEATFERLVRAVFMQRRKTLANALRPFAEAAQRDAAAALSAARVDSRLRPEALDLDAFVRLANIFAAAPPPSLPKA
jgi:16S rRNA (adenine1518-N6/adenine1519-N6)-dimethyltransferase